MVRFVPRTLLRDERVQRLTDVAPRALTCTTPFEIRSTVNDVS
jgi:hypothetical protein